MSGKVLNVYICKGRIFGKHDLIGKGDPYVIVKYGQVQKKTEIKFDTQDPVWHAEFKFDIRPEVKLLIFDVLDQDLFLDDDAIGIGRIEDINMYDKSIIGVGRKKELIDLRNPKGEKVGTLDVDILIEDKLTLPPKAKAKSNSSSSSPSSSPPPLAASSPSPALKSQAKAEAKPRANSMSLSDGNVIVAYPSAEDYYEGTVRGNPLKPHGKGKCIYGGDWKGRVYEGDWVDGRREGKGRMSFPSGSVYEGDFANDVYEGIGTYILPNGGKYVGGWANHYRNGFGTQTDKDGKVIYSGQWRDNKQAK